MEEEYYSEQPPIQPQQISGTPYQSPMWNYGSSIITLTSPEDLLYKLEMTYRSIMLDREGNQTKLGEPLMNEKGINSVIGQIQSIVNQVTVLSNLNKHEIPMLIDFLGDTLAKDLMVNRVKYGITTAAARDKIYFTALTTAFICMKRAYEEGDRRFWKGSVQEIRSTVEGGKRQGLMSTLLGWKRK